MNISVIYSIRNMTNNKKYIGSALNIRLRFNNHRHQLNKQIHDNAHLQAAWNKYGAENFEFLILEECSKEKLIEREQHYMDLMKPEYNIRKTAKNNLGYRWTDEMKKKLSDKKKGIPRLPEVIAKMRANNTGRKHSDETKARMSAAKKGKKFTAEHIANLNRSKIGRKRSEEFKAKMKQLMLNRKPASKETRKKQSEAHKLRWKEIKENAIAR